MSDIKKVQKKLRASEAARVKAVRRAEASEFNFGQNVKELRDSEAARVKAVRELEACKVNITKLYGRVHVLETAAKKLKKEATA